MCSKNHRFSLFLAIVIMQAVVLPAFCQENTVASYREDTSISVYPKSSKKGMVVIETINADRIKAELIRINRNEIIFDPGKGSDAVAMRQYYIRPAEGHFKIESEYIQSVTMTRGRSIGAKAFLGASTGLVVGVGAGLSSLTENTEDFSSFGEWAVVTGLLTGAGATVGAFIGLFGQTRIAIHAQSENMIKVMDYFFRN